MYIIAEVGQAHEGSLGMAMSYIHAAKYAGVNAVKFQMHIADSESSLLEEWRVKFSYEDDTRYDYWKRMEFTRSQWILLKEECEKLELDFIVSPFSITALELCQDIGVKKLKIGSGEVSNRLLLDSISSGIEEVIISSGLSHLDELKEIVNASNCSARISILNCTSEYPCPPEKWAFNRISELKSTFPEIEIGHSDHSGSVLSGLAACLYGAELYEVHIVFDKRAFGPDSKSSLTIDELKELVDNVHVLQVAMKSSHSIDLRTRRIFTKSLTLRKSLNKGSKLTKAYLETTKPGNAGISADDYKSILGKRLTRDVKKGEFLNYKDLE